MALIPNKQSGVTLIELLVVVAIFALISSVLLFNFSDFSTNVSVRNLSQEIALSARKAQTYATSVRNIQSADVTSNAYPGYGISFSTVSGAINDHIADQKEFVLFADVSNGNRAYDRGESCGTPSEGDECVESFSILTADKIVKICAVFSTGDTCFTDAIPGTINVLFHRPSPDADICIMNNDECEPERASGLKVTVESAKGLQRTISIWNTGQIGVE